MCEVHQFVPLFLVAAQPSQDIFAIILKDLPLVTDATVQTLVMVFFSTVFSTALGLPLGILLCTSDPVTGIRPRPALNQILTRIVNILRSFPFIILMILLFPLSRIIVGTSIGTAATIVPLSIAAAPFVARIIESALKEIDPGVIQAARAIGSTDFQIIWKVLLPESLPSLVDGITLTIINLIGYSAMAGAVGGGGLGDLAIRYGYQRFRTDIMIAAVVIILLLVEIIQTFGTKISASVKQKR
jgi:D-methionine transport system permease protein